MSTSTGDVSKHNDDDAEKQDTIFNEIVDLSAYEKSLKSTRIWIYIVAVLWAVWGVVNYTQMYNYDQETALVLLGIYIAVALVFLILGLWSRKKPALAFLIALIFYVVVNGLFMYYTSTFSIQTIIIRILIIASVVKGYLNAREYEEMKRTMIDVPSGKE